MTKIICNQCGKEIKKSGVAFECYTLTVPIYSENKSITIDMHQHCLDKALFNMMSEFKLMPEKEDLLSSCNCPECRAEREEYGFDEDDEE